MSGKGWHSGSGTISFELTMGWFLLPHIFSQAQARMPADRRDTIWFPAFFSETWVDVSTELVPMTCLNIVLWSSRPWWVHKSRVRNTALLFGRAF